jgi:hypothetical protein
MKKMEIEGIIIPYKNVTDLNHKVKEVLSKVERKRNELQFELTAQRKKERNLKKFLGIEENTKEATK